MLKEGEGQSLWRMYLRATYVFKLARQTGKMQRRLQLLPTTDPQKELGFQGLRNMASKSRVTQVSGKGQTTYHLHGVPRTLLSCHPLEENRGEKTKEGNSLCSSLALCHNLQLLHQKRNKEYITEKTGKRKSHFCTWEETVSQVNCPYAPEQHGHSNLQHTRVHQICKCYWFIYMALYKQSSYYSYRNSNS